MPTSKPTQHFNQLTEAEAERLTMIVEECAEVIYMIAKIKRHGFESCHPNGGPTNREALQDEIGQLMASVESSCNAGELKESAISTAMAAKRARKNNYTHHQP